jgi:hypothetical protein
MILSEAKIAQIQEDIKESATPSAFYLIQRLCSSHEALRTKTQELRAAEMELKVVRHHRDQLVEEVEQLKELLSRK